MWRQSLWAVCCLALLLGAQAVDEPTASKDAVIDTKKATADTKNATTDTKNATIDRKNTTREDVICQTCVCDYDIQMVNCSNKDLTHHFPDPSDWACLTFQPKTVLFDHNNIAHLLPFARLDALEKLSLSHNHIAKIDDRAFWNLTNVVEIDLSHNHLTSEDFVPVIFQGHYAPENYEPLERLKVLRMGSNALHSLHPDIFMHLPVLEELYLDSNPFKVIDLHTHTAIGGKYTLKVLDLSRTGISKFPDHFLHTPLNLQRLMLSGNGFTDPPEGLADSHKLDFLDLSENPFTNLTSVPEMDKLTTLVVAFCPNLTEVGKEAFAKLPALTHLYLHSNHRLSKIHPYALVEPPTPPAETHVYPPIKTLHLHDNALGYLESSLVGRWDQVESLRLDGNPWVCDCENQWIVETLLPTAEKRDSGFGASLTCAEPVEMRGKVLRRLQNNHYHMRCLDRFGNRPELDAPILVGVLVGVLIAAPLTLALVMVWRRCSALPSIPGPLWAGLIRSRRRGNGDYSSAFYKPAETEPDFI